MVDVFPPDPFREHCRRVDAVATIAEPPTQWVQLRERFTAFLELDKTQPMRTRLTDAVINGSPDADIAALRAGAYAEQLDPQPAAMVTNAVKRGVVARMREVYAEVAAQNYARVAEAFNTAAGKFTAAAALVDVEASGSDMVDQPDKARKAWLDSERYAHQLTGLAATLETAAQLAGVKVRDDGARLALTVDPGDAHRRRCWEAWGADGRCGRWSALAALGVTIRAWPTDQLNTFEPYREPAPLERRVKSTGPPGIYEEYFVDPEDPDYQPRERVKPPPILAR
jgi:hypothetical protein